MNYSNHDLPCQTVDALRQVRLTAGNLCFGEGRELGVHVAIEDATGDSAVIEHVGGEMQIYHGKNITVMTNEPAMNKQYELLKQFQPWGGDLVLPKNLPGSVASEDRFVRLKYYIDYAPKPKSEAMAIANIKSLIASTNVPFGAPVSCHRRIDIFLPLLRLSQPLLSLSDSIKAGFTRHGGRALLIAPISESRNTAECVRSCLGCANSFSLHHQGLLFRLARDSQHHLDGLFQD